MATIDKFVNRYKWLKIFFGIIFIIFVARLMMLQLFNPSYRERADKQSLRNVTQYPPRGCIYDRNGELLVYNEVVYDLMVIPQMAEGIDTAFFCKMIGITEDDFVGRMRACEDYSRQVASVFMKQISKNEYASWQSYLYRFKGFYVTTRTLRIYDKPIAAHILGYVGEVDQKELENDHYYRQGDYIGKAGLEQSYEQLLRGRKGAKIVQVDVHSREIGPYLNGSQDTIPQEGINLYTSIDAGLQAYGEKLMANKRGCIIAIEPKSGEVLAMVSAPCYDPNLLVGRVRGDNYKKLALDISKPLYNRALQGQYPPGSIFKVAQAMIGLDLGVITPNSGFVCDKSLIGCHNHPSASCVRDAIKMSCNPYFYQVYRRIIQQNRYRSAFKDSQYGLAVWCEYMHRFGFGSRLAIDLPGMSSGKIPDTAYYNRVYGKERWAFSNIYSNSIGQGEVTVVPLQMANLACIVANRGYYYEPHVVRYYGEDSVRPNESIERHDLNIPSEYFEIAAEGMYLVCYGDGGTGHRAQVPGIKVCGKTGTAENNGIDHSVFISFAPKDDPKIAVAVYVENAGAGGVWAAPIASLMIERYINGKVERPDFERTYMEARPCQSLPLAYKPKKKSRR